jgi:hypothetical protein
MEQRPEVLEDLVDQVETLDKISAGMDDDGQEESDVEFNAPDPSDINPSAGLTKGGGFDAEAAKPAPDVEIDSKQKAKLKIKIENMSEEALRGLASNTDGVDEELPRPELEVQLVEQAGQMLRERQQMTGAPNDD